MMGNSTVTADVAIIGAGVAGLMTARFLLQAGVDSIVLCERSAPGQEASWAGGGIVSPLYPWTYSDAVTALATASQAMYPELAHALYAETGINPELQRCGLLVLDADTGTQAQQWAQAHGKAMHQLGADAVQRYEPALAAPENTALWLPEVSNVRNPRLLQALLKSVMNDHRVRVLSDCEIDEIEEQTDAVKLAATRCGRKLLASQVLICAGAWSNTLTEPLGINTGIEPVKGEMLLYPPQPGLLRSIVLYKGKYLIPRMDGRILVGSTLEYAGFDKALSAGATEILREFATALVPELVNIEPEKQWAGLRPGSAQGIPLIGPLPASQRVFINAGHFRNGLVLAPASAALAADLMLARAPQLDSTPYQIANREALSLPDPAPIS